MKIEVPSGRKFYYGDAELMRQMNEHGFIRWEEKPFRLKSGIDSHFYVFGREDITDHPKFEWKLGQVVADEIEGNSELDDKQPCLIGLPTAGTAIAQAAVMAGYHNSIKVSGCYICHRVMREKLKVHGVHNQWVNGSPDPEKHTYWWVDNVITDSESKFTARERLRENGYPVDDMPSLILVDRQQGGIEKMEKGGFKRIVVVYYILDIVYAFGELKLWPKSTFKKIEEEIKAHQFV